jgi:LmbE family N-acetylglucosaminyl deacetylase
MATAVFLHAHPDDESIATGGTMAKAAAQGQRVVLVIATDGDEGEPVPGVLRDGETLAERRKAELALAAADLGADLVVHLGYRDSGMMGTPANDHPDSFWQADVERASVALADILRREQADVLVTYDDHGGYGHPDHIQVHRVGVRAAELAGTAKVYEASANRDEMRRFVSRLRDEHLVAEAEMEEREDRIDVDTFGTAEAELTHRVDVDDFVLVKRQALARHESQVASDHFFLAMPIEAFRAWAGVEWFRDRSWSRGDAPFRDDLFA